MGRMAKRRSTGKEKIGEIYHLLLTFPCPKCAKDVTFKWPLSRPIELSKVDATLFSLYCKCGWQGQLMGKARTGLVRA